MPKLYFIIGGFVTVGLIASVFVLYDGDGQVAELQLASVGGKEIKRKEVVKADTLFYGEEQAYGGGTARTYFSLLSEKPFALGVELSANALHGLDKQAKNGLCYDTEEGSTCIPVAETILHFPKEADITPFSWVMLNWESESHQSLGVYEVPHIDFHFFVMDEEKRMEIKPGECEDAPDLQVDCETFARGIARLPDQFQPREHESVGSVEAGTGNHLIDLSSQEFNGEKFTHTFIYGTYDGKLTFFEPMITREYLLSQPKDICSKTKLPGAFEQSGWYPTRYCMWYQESSNTYTVSLEMFEYVQAR